LFLRPHDFTRRAGHLYHLLPDRPASYQLVASVRFGLPFSPHRRTIRKSPRIVARLENVMSNLSFARIMYGSTQENPAPALTPVSNVPSSLYNSSQSSLARAASHATVESLLHKALLVFSHKH